MCRASSTRRCTWQDHAFRSVIDEHMGLKKRGKAMMRMPDDAEFSSTADCQEQDPIASAHMCRMPRAWQ